MSRRFRVAMVTASPFPTLGGSQVLTRQLAEALAARGHDVHLVTYHLKGAAPPVALPTHRIPPVPGYAKLGAGPAWGKPFLDVLLAGRLLQVVQRERIQIIHAHNVEALACGLLVRAWTGAPVVYHGHNVFEQELPAYFGRRLRHLARRVGWAVDATLPRRADAVIVLTQFAAETLRAHGVPAERLHLIPPGIDCPPLPPRRVGFPACPLRRLESLRHDSLPDTFKTSEVLVENLMPIECIMGQNGAGSASGNLGGLVWQKVSGSKRYDSAGAQVVYAGNLDPYQDMELLLRCWPHVLAARSDATLTLISASLPKRWQRLEADMDIAASVRFVLGRDFGKVWATIAAADVVVCPRTSRDGFPIKLLNYMAAGRPIVVSAGSAHGLTHGETAHVVADGDERAFAAGIVALLDDPALARHLGDAARELARTRHDWAVIAQQVEAIYETVA